MDSDRPDSSFIIQACFDHPLFYASRGDFVAFPQEVTGALFNIHSYNHSLSYLVSIIEFLT